MPVAVAVTVLFPRPAASRTMGSALAPVRTSHREDDGHRKDTTAESGGGLMRAATTTEEGERP